MKTKIIPTLFALDKKTFDSKLKSLNFAKNIHIDFMDGKFTKNKSVTLEEMKSLNNYKKEYEIHLMAKDPIQYLEILKKYNITKVLIQYEVFKTNEDILKQLNEFKRITTNVFIVINPKTQIDEILPILSKFDGIMVMGVNPGAQKQKFKLSTLNKIKTLRKLSENLKIQVDGGIKLPNARKISSFGANILSIGSAISSSKNPKLNSERFSKLFT